MLKVVSTGINYYLVPLLLGVLSKEDYGIWITLSTMLIWSQFFDVGLGNGLKNHLSQAVAREDVNEQASVVVTGAIAMLLIGIPLFCALSVSVDLIDWSSFLEFLGIVRFNQVLRVVGSLMILQFLLSITTSIFSGAKGLFDWRCFCQLHTVPFAVLRASGQIRIWRCFIGKFCSHDVCHPICCFERHDYLFDISEVGSLEISFIHVFLETPQKYC